MREPRETEVKLRVSDLTALRRTLVRAGARLADERHLEDDVLFDDAAGSLRAQGAVLRLRRMGKKGLLTFKGPRAIVDGIKSREEREARIEDPDALESILVRLGYRRVFRYQKRRESWQHRGQTVALDETPIGTFAEIEGDGAGIRQVAAELGYAEQDFVPESYAGLFFAEGGQGDMVFDA